MGAIETLRDALYGNPPSATKEPSREGVLAAFSELYDQSAVAIAVAALGIATVASIAARDTFYATPANQSKLVYVNNNNGAADDPANGVYEYVGGSARLAEGFYSGLASFVQPLVDQAQAAVEAVEDLSADFNGLFVPSPIVGKATEPVSGPSNLSMGKWVFADTFEEAKKHYYLWFAAGDAAGTVTPIVVAEDGSTVASGAAASFEANEVRLVTIDSPLTQEPGQRMGVQLSADNVGSYSSGTAWGDGYFFAGSGNVDFDDEPFTGAQLEFGFFGREVAIDAATVEALTERTDALKSLTTTATHYVGRQSAPVASGVATGGSSIALQGPMASSGHVRRIQMRSGSGSGAAYLLRYRMDGTVLKAVGPETSFAVTANADIDVTDLDFAFDGDDWLVLYAPADSVAYTATTVDNSGFFSAGGGKGADIETSGGISTSARMEIRITVERIEPKPAAFLNRRGAAATGYDTIVEQFVNGGTPKVQIGFQNVDDQDPQAGFVRTHATQHASWFDLTTYQYGGTIKGWGAFGDTLELQLSSDTASTRKPTFSVRDRLGRAGMGAFIQTRPGDDSYGFGLNLWNEARPTVGPYENVSSVPDIFWLDHSRSTGGWGFAVQETEVARFTSQGFQFKARATAPTPDADSYIIWQKEAGGADDGDLMVTINSGGATKTATLIDFSALP